MKMLVIDINKLEDFIFVLKQTEAVVWVDRTCNASMDKLVILPQAAFPVMYCHFAEPGSWEPSIMDHFQVIHASINDE